jgi:hypothetical protein
LCKYNTVKKLLSASIKREMEEQGVDWTTADARRGKAAYAPQHSGDNARIQASAAKHLRTCTVLGYIAASSGSFLSMFRDKLSVPSSGIKNPEEGTDRLSRNFGKKLPLLPIFAT